LLPGIEALQQIVCKQQVLWYLVYRGLSYLN
jgi:hypothetical protein